MTIAIPTTHGIGAVLRRAHKQAKTANQCWRDSLDVDDVRCARFVHPADQAEAGAIIQAVEEWDDRRKEAGKRCGPLRTKGIRIMRYLLAQSAKHGGLCCPSHEDIGARVKLAVSAVKKTLRALRLHGFLEWQRRTVPLEGDGPGPRRQQTTNLYRVTLPKAVAWRARQLMLKAGKKVRQVRTILGGIAEAFTPAQILQRAEAFLVAEERRSRTVRSLVDRALASLGRALEEPSPEPPSAISIA